MSGKTLVIVTSTNRCNHDFFDKKILGLTSIEWIVERIGKKFDKIVYADKEYDDKTVTCVSWDNTLVDFHHLKYQNGGVRLCAKTFAYIQSVLQSHVLDDLQKDGVVLHSRQGLHIDKTASISGGVEIFAPNVICGEVAVGQGTVIYPYCFVDGCKIGCDCSVGPFATIRPNSVVGDGCRVGNFVEIKNSLIGDGVKAAHLAYIGDAEVGEDTNVGCGVVFANFDGIEKNKTVVGKSCFLGCNSNLVAPLDIGDESFVAAGTTVTKNVGRGSFVIGRVRQQTKGMGD